MYVQFRVSVDVIESIQCCTYVCTVYNVYCNCRIQCNCRIHFNCRIHCVIIIIRQQCTGMTSQWGVTPHFGAGQTPMVGSMTPMHGVGSGRTPMYGSQTPQHGDGQLIY